MTKLNTEPSRSASAQFEEYVKAQQEKSLLRFITCGSVDDGKSTLIGRMLFDSKMLSDDQLETFEVESRKLGTQGEGLDFALLVDGLSAEREQGITIDVAYRFFSTKNRKFIVADTPGHEQFTRNMITGASTADLGIILVDARQGILTQTKRHSYLINLLGIKQIVLAVNKMDLVHYDRHTYDRIVSDYQSFADSIGIEEFTPIPISGLAGDNIAQASEHMSWFEGKTLLEHLDTVDIEQSNERGEPFQMSVQWVNRPNSHFRGYTGLITKGKIKQNDDVRIVPSGKLCSISEIFCSGEKREDAVEGEAVTLTFKEEVDCSRGQVIVSATSPLETSDQFESTIFWMDTKELMVGRSYWMKIGTQTVSATVQQPKFEINVNNQEHIAAKTLKLNAIGVANITTSQQIAFTSYKEGKDLGGFILVDKMTNQTAASGIINFSLRRASNIHWQDLEISREQHAAMKGQNPLILWMTGLSGSGKSAIANALQKKLVQSNLHSFLLDGDNIRHGLNKDLGFTEADRIENMRRVGEVSKLMLDAGLIVISAFISPFASERKMIKDIIPSGEFLEVFIDTPLEVAEKRDVKGLYAKARAGQIKNFTGIDSPFEPPLSPDIHIKTTSLSVNDAAEMIFKEILSRQQ